MSEEEEENSNRRTLTLLAIAYLLVSVTLFGVYFYASREYFYRFQKAAVNDEIKAEENIILRNLLLEFRTDKIIADERKASYEIQMEKTAETCLGMARKAIQEFAKHLDKNSVGNNSKPVLENRPFTINPSDKKPDGLEALNSFFDEISGGEDDHIILRRHDIMAPNKMTPLDYQTLKEETVEFFWGDKKLRWVIRALGKSFESTDHIQNTLDRIKEIQKVTANRMLVFRFRENSPIYSGDNVPSEPNTKYPEETSLQQRNPFFWQDSKEHVTSGQEQITWVSYMSDPEQKLTIVLKKTIHESEWMKYSFFDRNLPVILTFAALAWLVFPFLAFVSYRYAMRVRLSMTTDLGMYQYEDDSYHDEHPEPVAGEAAEAAKRKQSKEDEPEVEDRQLPESTEPAPVRESNKAGEQPEQSRESVTHSRQRPAYRPPSALTAPETLKVRENNIRKSKGSFVRGADEEEDADVFESVQSDVLKALVKKLRQGE